MPSGVFVRSKKMKINMSLSKLGEKNPLWKGDNLSYGALHTWVKRRLPKTKLCQLCDKNCPYDLANKGIYNRELKNWWWLCRSCHMKTDGRTKKLIENAKKSNNGKKQTKEHIAKRQLNRKTGKIIKCKKCKKAFYVQRYMADKSRYCSRICAMNRFN